MFKPTFDNLLDIFLDLMENIYFLAFVIAAFIFAVAGIGYLFFWLFLWLPLIGKLAMAFCIYILILKFIEDPIQRRPTY